MTTGSRAPLVDGFSKISFWRERNVGIITLLAPGMFNLPMISELVKSLSIAAVDDNVKSILITGSNYSFSKGLDIPKNLIYADLRNFYENLKSLILFILSFDKPIFISINGSASNNGVAFSLLGDEIFISNSTKLKITNEEPMVFLYTLSAPGKIKITNNEIQLDGIKLDTDNMMNDSLNLAENLSNLPYSRKRRYKFSGFENTLLQEELDFLDFYLWCQGKSKNK